MKEKIFGIIFIILVVVYSLFLNQCLTMALLTSLVITGLLLAIVMQNLKLDDVTAEALRKYGLIMICAFALFIALTVAFYTGVYNQ